MAATDEAAALSAFGRHWGSAEMFALGRQANENPPKLHAFDAKGFRRDTCRVPSGLPSLMGESVAAGLHASTWTSRRQACRRRRPKSRARRASTWRRRSRPGTYARSP